MINAAAGTYGCTPMVVPQRGGGPPLVLKMAADYLELQERGLEQGTDVLHCGEARSAASAGSAPLDRRFGNECQLARSLTQSTVVTTGSLGFPVGSSTETSSRKDSA